MGSKPVLYSYWGSSCPWRVRAALALLEIDYEYRGVNLRKSEQRSASYVRLNPAGTVPTLVLPSEHSDGADLVLCDSIAIMLYLDETRGGKAGLLPEGAAHRARVLQLSNMVACGIQPVQNVKVCDKMGAIGTKERMAWGKYWIEHGFHGLEAALTETSGDYCYGDTVTMADCCLVPQVYNAISFDVPMEQFPTIKRVHDRLIALPMFIQSHPDKQPDCPHRTD